MSGVLSPFSAPWLGSAFLGLCSHTIPGLDGYNTLEYCGSLVLEYVYAGIEPIQTAMGVSSNSIWFLTEDTASF